MSTVARLLVCFLAGTAAAVVQAETSAITETLPIEVQVDLLMAELAELVAQEDNEGIVALVPRIRALDIEIPDSLYFLEARALFHTGQALAARDRLLAYLANTGREGRYYEQATELLLDVKGRAAVEERERREREARRAVELEEAAIKARVLRTREAQRRLHALGFWLGSDSGVLDQKTRESIAVFQVRRNLSVDAEVTDELLAALRDEVPAFHECDRLAFSPDSPLSWEPAIDGIDAAEAIRSCNEALRRYPDVIRFQVQYARALLADDRNDDARVALDNAVSLGYPRAQNLLGRMYEMGRLSPKGRPEFEQAAGWYERAAEREYPESRWRLGMLYESGDGVARSDETAFDYYVRAAEQGYAPAQVAAGRMLEHGRGAHRDYVQALAWYKRAADQGFSDGEYLLGRMYERGRGVKRDRTVAMMWFTKAADQGHEEASLKVERR